MESEGGVNTKAFSEYQRIVLMDLGDASLINPKVRGDFLINSGN